MKKTVSIMLCLLLIFSSVNFAFADFTTTDSNNLQSIRNTLVNTTGGTIYYMLSQINASSWFSNKSVANWLSDIENILASTLYQLDGNSSRSIAWWVKEAVLDLDTLTSTSSGSLLYYISEISGRLTNIYDKLDATRQTTLMIKENTDDIFSYLANLSGSKTVTWMRYQNGTLTFENRTLGFFDFITSMHNYGILPFANMVLGEFNQSNGSYNSLQTALNWTDIDSSYTFTPTSSTDGLYKWFATLQAPLARLSYVLASDERIEAQEAAAANEQAVVDNFIDSTGSGAAPASSFSNVASMSAGYTSNMGTDASASGIWNIFNSNNFGWFSQETANQLDTTVSTRRSPSEYETPLLDKQIADIYKELGVDVND